MRTMSEAVKAGGRAVAGSLSGRRVAILATDGVEQVELEEPRAALLRAGALVEIVSPKRGPIQGMHHHQRGDRIDVDRSLSGTNPADYDALVLPGGVVNPDSLRTCAEAVQFVRNFIDADKPVGAICHAPWLLVEADAVRGRTLTSYPSLRTDIQNAGGTWVDKEVQVDQRLVTSRKPADLPAFCARLISIINAALQERQVDLRSEMSFPASDPPAVGPMTIGGTGASRERAT
jgi:protease I